MENNFIHTSISDREAISQEVQSVKVEVKNLNLFYGEKQALNSINMDIYNKKMIRVILLSFIISL